MISQLFIQQIELISYAHLFVIAGKHATTFHPLADRNSLIGDAIAFRSSQYGRVGWGG